MASSNVGITQTTNILPVQALYDPTTLAFVTFIGPAGLPFTSAAGGVSSVQVSGGTTGLTTSGGPIVSSGTITLGGTLAVGSGGTGATTNTGALTNLLPSQSGNAGYFLKTDGTNVTWAQGGSGLTIVTDNTTNASRYLAFTSATSGVITTENVSTGLTFNPSSNTLTTTTFVGALTGNASTATTATTATNLAGGASGSLPYQSASGVTTFLAAGSNGQYLVLSGGVPSWGSISTVSSFSGGTTGLTPNTATTGAVTLAGTLATANGGTGNTTGTAANVANAVTFNNSGTGAASGTTYDGSAARTVSYNTLGASPTAGSTSIVTLGTVTTGTWNATAIGATYGGTGITTYTTGDTLYASASNTLSKLAIGSTNQVLTVSGGVPTWANAQSATSITDDTTTASARYINFTSATSGSLSTIYTSSTKLQYLPSTGILTATGFTGTIGTVTPNTGAFSTLSGNSVTSTTPVLSFNASNTIASFGTTTSGSYNQLLIQNQSNTANASSNYVISNNLGTDSTYYGEFGMNSSSFSTSTPSDFFSINNGIYFSGHDGDISVGSGNGFKTYFPYGATPNNAHVINASGALGLSTNLGTTPSTSGTTGYGTSGQPLISGGSSAAPTWATVTGTGTTFVVSTAPTISNPTITAYLETAPALTNSSTAVTLSLSSGTVLSYTLTGNCTFTMPTATSGTSFILKLIQDGTGSRTATFTGVKWPAGTAPTITTTASTGLDILSFVCINSVWYGTYAQAFA